MCTKLFVPQEEVVLYTLSLIFCDIINCHVFHETQKKFFERIR